MVIIKVFQGRGILAVAPLIPSIRILTSSMTPFLINDASKYSSQLLSPTKYHHSTSIPFVMWGSSLMCGITTWKQFFHPAIFIF